MYHVILLICFLYPAFYSTAVETAESRPLSALGSFADYESLNVITGEWIEAVTDIEVPGPQGFSLKRWFDTGPRSLRSFAAGWQFNLPEVGEVEWPRRKLAPPDAREYRTEFDDHHRLKRIEVVQPKTQAIESWIAFTYSADSEGLPLRCQAAASHGDTVEYFLKLDSTKGALLLSRVECKGKPACDYQYVQHPKERKLLLGEKREQGGPWLKFDYTADGRLKTIERSCDAGREYSLVCSLEYGPKRTLVSNARGVSMCYYYNEDEEIERIETWVPHEDQTPHLYRLEEWQWKNGRVAAKIYRDENSVLLFKEQWEYDAEGNIIEESLSGKLTCLTAADESYRRFYSYNASNQLIEQREENGKRILYTYDPITQKLSAEFFLSGEEVVQRTFYQYDSEGRCISTKVDDGCVVGTERAGISVCVFQDVLDFDLYGVPQETVQGYFDLSENKVQLKRSSFTFDSSHLLVCSFESDALGTPCASQHCLYTSEGLLIETRNLANDYTQFTYDNAYHCISRRECKGDSEIVSHLSATGQILEEEHFSKGKRDKCLHYTYDPTGLLSGLFDQAGRCTAWKYDALGRKISETNAQGFTARWAYDAFDRVVESCDALGYRTSTVFNARSQPLQISYPDGTDERFEYAVDGSICKEVRRDGTFCSFSYDGAGRLKNKSEHAADGACLVSIEYKYKGFKQIGETHSSGLVLHHSYDLAGRKCETLAEPVGRKIEYRYHISGVLESTREWYGTAPDAFSERRIDPVTRKEALFDHNGNLVLASPADSPVVREEPEHAYIYNLRQELVLLTTETTSEGTQITVLHDRSGRAEVIEKRSALNVLIFHQEAAYDAVGNKVSQIDWIFSNGKKSGEHQIQWRFGPCGRIEEMVVSAGSEAERRVSYTYNAFGQLESVTKSDGVCLNHCYNAAGKLARFYSSDGSVDYGFDYDGEGRWTKAHDFVENRSCIRSYSIDGLVDQEILGNHLPLSYTYDLFGRKECTVLPDGSAIRNKYNAAQLTAVVRYDAAGKELYAHYYILHDTAGRVAEEDMIAGLGKKQISWDLLGPRPKSIESAFFRQELQLNGSGRLQALISRDIKGVYESDYSYDPLNQLEQESGAFQKEYCFDSFEMPKTGCEYALSYDLNGNLLTKDHVAFSYDALNRLKTVRIGESEVHRYTYDALHRRIIDKCDNQVYAYIFEGIEEIGRCDADGKIDQLRIRGAAVTGREAESVAFELKGVLFAPLYDLHGSVVALVAAKTKQVAEYYRYSAFGICAVYQQGSTQIQNPWRFAGKRLDEATGLVSYSRRDYDPELMQWTTKDPIGFADGPNLYAFLHNDPLNAYDLHGLKTISDYWQAFKTYAWNSLKKIGTKVLMSLRKLRDYTSLDLPKLKNYLIGKGFLLLLGDSKPDAAKGTYGKGEVSDKVRVSFINGILTDFPYMYQSLQALSETHGGVNVHYVYRPTRGWVTDILSSLLVKLGHVSTQAHQLADEWKLLINEMGGVSGGGKIIHYAHSIGAIETMRALQLLTPEEQKLVEVYAFGSPSVAVENPNYNVHHYISIRDGVSLLDIVSFVKCCVGKINNVTFIGNFGGVPFIDHFFFTETYADRWKAMGRTFTDWYGTIARA